MARALPPRKLQRRKQPLLFLMRLRLPSLSRLLHRLSRTGAPPPRRRPHRRLPGMTKTSTHVRLRWFAKLHASTTWIYLTSKAPDSAGELRSRTYWPLSNRNREGEPRPFRPHPRRPPGPPQSKPLLRRRRAQPPPPFPATWFR